MQHADLIGAVRLRDEDLAARDRDRVLPGRALDGKYRVLPQIERAQELSVLIYKDRLSAPARQQPEGETPGKDGREDHDPDPVPLLHGCST